MLLDTAVTLMVAIADTMRYSMAAPLMRSMRRLSTGASDLNSWWTPMIMMPPTMARGNSGKDLKNLIS
eukprot:scaffold390353_cov28-Prasinocladus_malaysianus.AAC.1